MLGRGHVYICLLRGHVGEGHLIAGPSWCRAILVQGHLFRGHVGRGHLGGGACWGGPNVGGSKTLCLKKQVKHYKQKMYLKNVNDKN